MVKIWKVSSHLEDEPEIEAAREEKKKDANTKSMDEALLQLWRSARGNKGGKLHVWRLRQCSMCGNAPGVASWGEGWYGTG